VEAGGGDTPVAEEALQIGDVHTERQQAGRHCVTQQMRIDRPPRTRWPAAAWNGVRWCRFIEVC
jgi:hypothetical protein